MVSFTIVLCQYLRHCLSLVRDVTPLTSNVAYKTVQGLCASRLPSLLSEWPSDFTAKKQAAAMEALFQMRCNSALGSPCPSLSWP